MKHNLLLLKEGFEFKPIEDTDNVYIKETGIWKYVFLILFIIIFLFILLIKKNKKKDN